MKARSLDRIGIYRIPHPKHGYVLHVTLRRDGVVFQKRFSEHRCGEAAALRMALAWRDSIVARNPALTLAKFCAIVRGNNSSGIPGVARREKTYRTAGGKTVVNAYWVARIPRGDGTSTARCFPIGKLGEDEAKRRAIAARAQGLAELDNVVFRQEMQPLQVSSQADMDALEAMLNAPRERRAREAQQLAEREKRRAKQKQQRLAAQRLAAVEREVQLSAPTNRSGEPYISRYETNATTGGWCVSMIRKGVRHRKIFSDSVFGGADAALSSARAWRDRISIDFPALPIAAVVARVSASNTSGTAGVSFSRPSGKSKHGSWVARSPKIKGTTMRSKRFSVEKYGNDRALALAVEARLAFVQELAEQPFLRHAAAWQMQKLQENAESGADRPILP